MNAARWLPLASLIAIGCGPGILPKPTPANIAAMPDTIPCQHAVKVQGSSDLEGSKAEHRWLDALYPHHGPWSQGLHVEGERHFDIFTFTRANGHATLVCFDITDTFGHWGTLRF